AFWRGRAHADPRTLSLGSKSSTAGQLPLMMMRKQKLVDRLAGGQRLDPSVIGLPAAGAVKWRMFYAVGDILCCPARRLFDPNAGIEESQVDTNWRPDLSHSDYWTNGTVLTQVSRLLVNNLA